MSLINNSTPMVISLGIQDNSITVPAVTETQIPTHLPLTFLFAQKGRTKRQLVVGAGRTVAYGADTFDTRKKYSTHTTELSNIINAAGNAQMIERLQPVDAAPPATLLLTLDVLKTNVPVYQRNSDGSYLTNSITGLPQPVTPAQTVPGYILKWVIGTSTTFGQAAVTAGDQTDTTGATSTRYPIFEWQADSFGDYYNQTGFRLYAPISSSSTPVNSTLLEAINAYPFRLTAISKYNSSSTPTIVPMVTGDQTLEFVLMPNAINPNTDATVSLSSVFPNAWSSINNVGFQDVYGDLSNLQIYQSNIDTILAELYTAEAVAAIGQPGTDFTTAVGQTYLTNFISAQSSTGIPYYAVSMNNVDANSITLGESTNLFASGGSDGTINETVLGQLVATRMADYANPNSQVMDIATNVESIIYDSGFPLETKKALTNFISIRKDTFVVLSTYSTLSGELTESDEAAIGLALKAQLSMFPESSYYGTPTIRGLIMARYDTLIGSNYSGKLPISLELASKAAMFMGASDGIWNDDYLFDKAPNTILTMFKGLNVSFVPAEQRTNDWANGINYPIPFNTVSVAFPGLKTVCSNDTSVLTNFFTAMACVELEKVGYAAWSNFTGNIKLTPAQLCVAVNGFISDNTKGRFAGLFTIVPNTTITSGDAQRGYSFTIVINIYANNSDTVATLTIGAYRTSSLTSTNT